MLEIQRAKEIKGFVTLPTNPDFFLLTLLIALASNRKTRIAPVNDTPLILRFKELLAGQLDITQRGETCTIFPKSDGISSFIQLPYEELPYRDFIVFLLLGLQKTITFKNLSPKRLEVWQNQAGIFNLAIESRQCDNGTGIFLSSEEGFNLPDGMIDPNDIHPCIGLAIGLRKKISFLSDVQFHSPLRHILPAFGYGITISSNFEKKDPLIRRLHFIAPNAVNKNELKLTFSISIDFLNVNNDEVIIDLPGDDILGAILFTAKSLVQRGQLILSNVPLEPWSCATLNYIRKMGCNTGTQEERQSSFGSTGTACLQGFRLVGHKRECTPLYQYYRQLPAMVTIAIFANGQSVFRGLKELHNETPDEIEQMLAIVLSMGGRHGEMPDGMVIEGAKQHDGFDMRESISATANGACAVAGLKCNGKSFIEETKIKQRWPSFQKILDNICNFKTG